AERMRKLHTDPEFKKANAERMRKLHTDPEFKKAHAERAAERMRKLNAEGVNKACTECGENRLHSPASAICDRCSLDRESDIVALRESGLTLAECGMPWELSSERVRQILKECGAGHLLGARSKIGLVARS
ncbi:hypothetical protein, partial [Algimonas porphyrae]